MSTKCTLLYKKGKFHFYFDYKDYGHHLEINGIEKKLPKEFMKQVAKLCELRFTLKLLQTRIDDCQKDFYGGMIKKRRKRK